MRLSKDEGMALARYFVRVHLGVVLRASGGRDAIQISSMISHQNAAGRCVKRTSL